MKIEITRKDFIKSWQLAERFVDTKSSNIKDKGVFIEAKDDGVVILKATDLKKSVQCKAGGVNVLEPGSAVIPILFFGSMLKKSESDSVILEIDSARGLLKSGKNKTKFAIIPANEFPKIPESSDGEEICTMNAEILAQRIAEGGSSASLPDSFPRYIGVCFLRIKDNEIKIASTDGKRLSLTQAGCENVATKKDLLLPAPELKEFGKIFHGDKNVQIRANDSTAWFIFDDIEFSLQLIDATFPQYERILNNNVETSLKIQTGDLISALERIDIIAKTIPAHIMALSLNPNGELTREEAAAFLARRVSGDRAA